MSRARADEVDLVILGGGSAGYSCALRARQLGLSVVLVEEDLLGGTCLHRGCVPTKALLHAAEIADATRDAATVGVRAELGGIDVPAVNAFKQGVVDRLFKGLTGLVDHAGVRVVAGHGVLVDATTVQVGPDSYRGRHLVLATGSEPRLLPGVELGPRVLTSDGALVLTEVPERAVVIGGSVIGVEFASVWRSFGADVTVVEALPSLVPLEDPAVSKAIARAFGRRGITAKVGTLVESVSDQGDRVVVTLQDGGTLDADLVLVAVGRGPRTDGLDLPRHDIALDRGWVVVDERLRTSHPQVRAVGDLVPGLQLAHRGFAHGIFVAEDLAGLDPEPVRDREIPRVTYCDPEIASVGLTEAEAEAEHGAVEVLEYNLAGNGRSLILGTAGFVKLVCVPAGPIVGVHMVGARMGEQVGEAALAVGWEAMPEDLARFIHAHPTQNEALGEAALALAGKPLHTHT